jgi:hypothetical protein
MDAHGVLAVAIIVALCACGLGVMAFGVIIERIELIRKREARYGPKPTVRPDHDCGRDQRAISFWLARYFIQPEQASDRGRGFRVRDDMPMR